LIGRVLSKYKILEEVGQGGMSVVYRGLDTSLQREVAVKVLHPHLAGSDEARQRFEREAHAVAKLRHENILEIFDYSGRDSSESYIVTEFIHGGTLRGFVGDKGLDLPEAGAMIVLEVCRALVHAHRQGILHRDVKPENIMIRDDGVVKLTDFGIAQMVDAQRMTVTGQLLGSPAYMAPEHVDGKPLDFRTDVFSVGILLYQLATGELPFKGRNPHEILKRIAECRYLDPRVVSARVSDELGRIISRSLQREPSQRYQDIAALEADLAAALAIVDLVDSRSELRALFADAEGYQAELRGRLVRSLTRRGQEALAKRQTARALAAWNRVLTLDPANAEVLGLIDALSRRRRLVRLALTVVGLALVGGSAAFAAQRWPAPMPLAFAHPPPPETRVPPAPPAPAPPPIAGRLALEMSRVSLDFEVRAVADPRPPVPEKPASSAPPVVTPQGPRAFRLIPSPQNASYSVDGAAATQVNAGSARINVGPGAHEIVFTHPLCDDTTVVIAADQAAEDITVRLPWKLGRLVPRCAAATSIVVEGKPVENGTPIDVYEFDRTGRKTHLVEFIIAGEVKEKRVTVVAGQPLVEVLCD
jgi:eukaryotic-like serine/threonine-protein kinase